MGTNPKSSYKIRNVFGICESSITVITSACQAEDGGSIPPSRSNVNLKKGPSVSLSGLLGPGLLKYGPFV